MTLLALDTLCVIFFSSTLLSVVVTDVFSIASVILAMIGKSEPCRMLC